MPLKNFYQRELMKPKIISVICLALGLAAFAFAFSGRAQVVAVPATRIQPVTVISNPLALPEEVRAMMESVRKEENGSKPNQLLDKTLANLKFFSSLYVEQLELSLRLQHEGDPNHLG